MYYAIKIRMKEGCYYSDRAEEIAEICLEGRGYYTKESLHDYLKDHPKTIRVKIPPYPPLIPAVSRYGEKYVKSAPNGYEKDNLLKLPRE